MNLPSKVIDIEGIYQKISEIEAIKNYDKVKLERDQAKARISELELQVQDYLQIKKERDEAQKKLTNLNDKAIEFVKTILTEISKPKGQRNYSPEIIATGLHSIIEYLIEEQVSQQVREASDDKLVSAFRNEVRKQVQQFLGNWPARLGRRTPERERMLMQKELEDPYVALRGTWKVPCNECKFEHEVNLETTGNIKQLLAYHDVGAVLTGLLPGVVKEHSRRASLAEIVGLFLRQYLYDGES